MLTIPDNSAVTVESREVDGVYQERMVITGPWQTHEKPAGLL